MIRLVIFIIITLVQACASQKTSEETDDNSEVILVGGYTIGGSEGIYQLTFNNNNGMLSSPGLLAEAVNPSFLAWNPQKDVLYSVNEVEAGGISAFKWEEGQSRMELTKHVPSEGSAPCHVSLSHSGKWVASANYSTGNVICYPVNTDGSLGDELTMRQNTGESGPGERQEKAHAHCGMFGKDDRFLYAVDLGLDKIIAYPMGEKGISGEPHIAATLDPGDGPRHLIFHPTRDQAFVINELSSTVVSMSVDHSTGIFQRIDKKSTLPADFEGQSFCADIHLTNDGRLLYGSNRGHNSIAVFEVKGDGTIDLLETESTRGDWPRNFVISPQEKYLLVANQKSNNVTVFTIDEKTGLLDYTGNQVEVFSPTCLIFK